MVLVVHALFICLQWLEIPEDPQTSRFLKILMPVAFACFSFLKVEDLNKRASMLLDIGILQIFKIPRGHTEPENPNLELLEEMSCLHEVIDENGFRTYPEDLPLGIPGPEEQEFQGLAPGQCFCCYYRNREILGTTIGGLALFTPGWYWNTTPSGGRPSS